jgi:hypothetical protein
MNSLSKFGLAAVLALGVSGAAMAQDAQIDAGAGAGAGADIAVDVDPMATGSISSHGNLVSSIQTTSEFDLSAYSDTATVSCIKVSTLQGDAQGNAQAVGNATMDNDAIATLRTDIQGNSELMTKLEASCAVAEFDVNDVVFFETGANGELVFYYDDRAA